MKKKFKFKMERVNLFMTIQEQVRKYIDEEARPIKIKDFIKIEMNNFNLQNTLDAIKLHICLVCNEDKSKKCQIDIEITKDNLYIKDVDDTISTFEKIFETKFNIKEILEYSILLVDNMSYSNDLYIYASAK